MLLTRLWMEVPILLVIFGFIAAMTINQNRSRERREKLRILEEAIRSGNLDPSTKQELVQELTGRNSASTAKSQPAHSAERYSGWSRAAFAIGWLGLFLGIGLIAIDDRDTWEPGIAITAVSFALVTLPIALRELERERGRAAKRR